MKGKFVFATLLLAMTVLFSVPAVHAQNQTFSLSAAPLMIPGSRTGQSTIAAAITGVTMMVTPNFDLRQDNVITSDGNLQGYFGGFNYRLPILSKKLNNMSPNLNGYNFQFYITGSAGADHVALPAGSPTVGGTNAVSHYAFLGGGGVNYKMTKGGAWSLGAEVRYAKLPGYKNNTVIISFGPTFHFNL